MGKTRGKKSFLGSSERIGRNKATGHFASGQLHDSAIHWNSILENSKSDQSTLVSNWLKDGDTSFFLQVQRKF